MPSLFDNRSAIDPRRSRGVGSAAPVATKPPAPKQQMPASSSAAIVPAAPAAWDGEPDIARSQSLPATPPSNTQLAGRPTEADSSEEEDYDDKDDDERKGLQIVKQRTVAAKYAAQSYAAKIPRDRCAPASTGPSLAPHCALTVFLSTGFP